MIRRLFACTALAILFPAWLGSALADPALVLANVETYRGGVAALRLRLENGDQSYAGVNAKIRVPQGATVIQAERGTLLPADFAVDTYVFNDGISDVVGVLAYSGSGVTSSNSGVLATVKLAIAPNAPVGQQNVQFSGAVTGLSNADGSESVAHTVSNGVITIAAEAIPNLKVTPKKTYVPYGAGQVTFTVRNTGSGTMPWTAKVRAGKEWASISGPKKGTNDGTFTVTFGANLGVATRTTVIRVSAPNAPNSPIKVKIEQGSQTTSRQAVGRRTARGAKALLNALRENLSKALVDGGAATTYAPLLPGSPDGDGVFTLRRDGSIFLRIRSEEPINPDSVWADVQSAYGAEGQVVWLGVEEGSLTDGWIVYTPNATWMPGELLAVSGFVETVSGALLQTESYSFAAESMAQATARALAQRDADPLAPMAATDVRSLAGGVGQVYRVAEYQAFAAPQRVWLPVPEGFNGSDLSIFYYQPTGDAAGWYPGENVDGWLVPGSLTIETIDGTQFLSVELRHGATLQLGVPSDAAGASIVPLKVNATALLFFASLPGLWALTLAMRSIRRRSSAAKLDRLDD